MGKTRISPSSAAQTHSWRGRDCSTRWGWVESLSHSRQGDGVGNFCRGMASGKLMLIEWWDGACSAWTSGSVGVLFYVGSLAGSEFG